MIPFPSIDSFPLLSAVPPFAILTVLIFLTIWTTVIKAFALWYAARNNQPVWFVALLVLNTLGLLELAYLLAFRKDKQSYVAPAPAVAPQPSDA
jgi:methionyl-tRNA synthetase